MPTAKNPLGMSDEDFSQLNSASEVPTTEEVVVTDDAAATAATEAAAIETAKVATETATETETPATETVVADDKTEEEKAAETVAVTAVAATEAAKKVAVKVNPVVTKEKPAGSEKSAATSTEATETTTETVPDYKALYERLMTPIKANGKTIDLKNPDEAIQLMQMGANYTKKMQAIAPHRKVLTMLENAGLLDENRLSFLIDLDKKNPEAIKKLVKDSGIDTLTLDEEPKTTYFEGNHKVSDEEVSFKSAVQDLRSNDGGVDTLQQINTWDQASKEVLWKNPDLMEVIHSQRVNGIYTQIASEIDRRRTLGTLPVATPFIHAYKAVGDELAAAGAFNAATATKTATVSTTATPITTRVATVKSAVTNNERVNAASSTRSTPKKAEKFVNPLALSDEEFLKQMAERL
jgi:hypothetical protein